MVRTLLAHPEIATMLLRLFVARFDPDRHDDGTAAELEAGDRAARSMRSRASTRIGFCAASCTWSGRCCARTAFGWPTTESRRPYLSFKLDPSRVPLLPLPRPRFEIFVYSPRVEGVHLRGGKVARGGLRWSDRPEDFRTEVLGLMKAQMVKNALIVPVGSKGGFVVKRPPVGGGREALQAEGIACYETFLAGLLDITDNIAAGEVVAAERVVRYDEDDPYLVVAADKGTASFSDIANEVSARYRFWLGDAFASGGSQGYDHKQMGITARGAWESVKRHFRELGTDIDTTDFTVVGIGDMSGDVFGNGMLLSPHLKLLAAFNHAHVFLDPDPDLKTSFEERRRLFRLARSSWSDYDETLISAGGGVYPRSAKSIRISEQVKDALAIEADELSTAELIKAILMSPVDLLWNGGIGTYIKASTETHADASDKANDAVRLDARRLRCRVVGEGGNLGFTQRGRIEYALAGGRINTDAIDNVAGVNCSDNEVNIKILLDSLIAAGDMTEKQRNALLVEMTDAVAEQVRYGSYIQTQALSLAVCAGGADGRRPRPPDRSPGADRAPGPRDRVPAHRRGDQQPQGRPPGTGRARAGGGDGVLQDPPVQQARWNRTCRRTNTSGTTSSATSRHRCRNDMRSRCAPIRCAARSSRPSSPTNSSTARARRFTFRLAEETGASPSVLARAYAAAREIFDMRLFWSAVEELDNQIDRADTARDADRGPPAGGACHAVAGTRPRRQDRHRGRDQALQGGGADARAGHPRRARGPRPRAV